MPDYEAKDILTRQAAAVIACVAPHPLSLILFQEFVMAQSCIRQWKNPVLILEYIVTSDSSRKKFLRHLPLNPLFFFIKL